MRWEVRQLSDGQEAAELPIILADREGGVHVFWTQEQAGERSRTLYYAYRQGGDWNITDIMVGSIEQPSAVIDDRGIIHLVWVERGEIRYSFNWLSQAARTRTWASPAIIGVGPAFHPYLVLDAHDILHLTYFSIGEPSVVYYLRSTDHGQTWSFPKVFESSRSDAATDRPRLAVGTDGVLHLVWSLIPTSSFYGGLGVYYAQSLDAGQSWSLPVRIDADTPDAPGIGAWMANIAVVGSSEVHIVWNAHVQAGRRYHQWSRDGGNTWSPPTAIMSTFVSQTGPNPMLIDAAGVLYLFSGGTLEWGKRQGVYLSRWTGATWTPPELVDQSSEEPHWLRVAVSEGNIVHIVWEARVQKPRGVWYVTARTNAPSLEPRPYPTLDPILTPMPPTPTPNSSPTPRATPVFYGSMSDTAERIDVSRHRGYALLAGILPALLLAGIIVAFRVMWPRH